MSEQAAESGMEVGGFRLGLSRLIRYSYGGLLLALLSALLEPATTKTAVEALSAPVAVVVAFGIGAAIYVFHRNLFIPLHHLILCGLFQILCLKKHSPTAFLNDLGVERFKRMLAYTLIRRSNFFEDKRARDIEHAESGLLVLTAEGMVVAAWYAGHYQIQPWWPYLVIGVVFYIASYVPAVAQHSWECFVMRVREKDLKAKLVDLGLLAESEPAPKLDAGAKESV